MPSKIDNQASPQKPPKAKILSRARKQLESFQGQIHVECLLPLPISKIFTYFLHDQTPQWQENGTPLFRRAIVDFRSRKYLALIVAVVAKPSFACKAIDKIIDQEAILGDTYLELLYDIADLYLCHRGEVLGMALPSGRRLKYDTPMHDQQMVKEEIFKLNLMQQEALDKLRNQFLDCMHKKRVSLHLLHGVTGSGKTEVYFQLMAEVIKLGYCVLLLVPEINMSAYLIKNAQKRFGHRVVQYHSRLSRSDKLTNWYKAHRGQSQIFIGTRSAIFLPIRKLALVILDEEQASTYKENSSPRYHARQIAQLRLKGLGGLLVLGSATPTIETYYLAMSERIAYSQIPRRVNNLLMPASRMIDMTTYINAKNRLLTQPLVAEMKQTLEKGQQVILLLNRRGYAPVVRCMRCLKVANCPNCDITLSFHRRKTSVSSVGQSEDLSTNKVPHGFLVCHYCGYQRIHSGLCSYCQSDALTLQGIAIQRVEEELAHYFYEYKIKRLDMDSQGQNNVSQILSDFEQHNIDILLGTQMIAKGFDFPNVTLVGVLMADIGLGLPDFRATERIFSLLTQVSGRSGRGEQAGQVLIQTLQINNPLMRQAMNQDYKAFYDSEIALRRALFYPPFSRLLRIVLRNIDQSQAQQDAQIMAEAIKSAYSQQQDDRPYQLLGPVPAPFFRLHDRFRYHILIKESHINRGREILRFILQKHTNKLKSYVEVDLDPLDIL